MVSPDTKREQEALLRRLESMGLQVRLMRGGHCVLASIALDRTPFDGPAGARRIPKALFTTVGSEHIKCLRPRSLFQLPKIRIVTCSNARSIETRIRHAWKLHVQELRDTHAWLKQIGARPEFAEKGSVASFPIEGEQQARAIAIDRRHVILPSQGPLEGLTLESPEQRVLDIGGDVRSNVDLSIAISTRIEHLVRDAERLDHRRRTVAMIEDPRFTAEPAGAKLRHKVLLVGPELTRQRSVAESLRLRGYRVITAKSEHEALEVFDAASPELVMTDMSLGRSEGLDLMLSLHRLCGVENIPVLVVDTTRRPAKREAARSLGAAGYLLYPLDLPKLAPRIAQLVTAPQRRRFTRYPNRLALTIPGTSESGLLTALSRGGMFVSMRRTLPINSQHEFTLKVPQAGEELQVLAEVVYQLGGAGARLSGVGVRFSQFTQSDEALLIDYLRSLE